MTSFLHIDMDAFFASVEELDNPGWRGKPIIVGSDPKEGRGRGVVSTASYAARKFGVGSAMPISRAWKRCPHAVFVRPRMSRYAEVSGHVMEIFKSFTPLIQPISLDEAFLDVTGSHRIFGDPVTIAKKVKKKVLDRTGLTCSVGVSSVKSVAKIASDMDKPDGLTTVPDGKETEFLAPLEVRKLWGIGPKAAKLLAGAGIRFVHELQRCSISELAGLVGKAGGEHFFNMANAIDPREVVDDEKALSISHETTFLSDVQDPDTVARTFLWLADKVGSRLRASGLKGRTISLKYRTESFKTYTRRLTLDNPVDDTGTLCETAKRLAVPLEGKGKKVRLLGIGITGLVPGRSRQMTLFEEGKRPRNEAFDRVVDRVRTRFGKGAIIRGSLMEEE